MELVSLWIGQYKALNDTTVVFSSKYKLNKEFDIQQCTPRPSVYGAFNNITAFVGKNGSGKTSIVEALMLMLDGSELIDGNLIVEIDNELYSIGYESKFTFKKKPVKKLNLQENQIRKLSQVLFYSPVYNPHSDTPSLSRRIIKNVSSDKIYSYGKRKNQEQDFKSQFEFLDRMYNFSEEYLGFKKYLEVTLKEFDIGVFKRKILKILLSPAGKNSQRIKKEILSKLDLSIARMDMVLFDRIQEYEDPEEYEFKLKEFRNALGERFRVLEERIKNQIEGVHAIEQVKIYFLLRFLDSNLKVSSSFFRKDFRDKNVILIDIISSVFEIPSLVDWFNISTQKVNKLNENYNIQFASLREDIESFLDLVRESKIRNKKFPFHFAPDRSESALMFISGLRKRGLLKYGFNIGWKGISSGQIAKMNLYSRIFSAIEASEGQTITLLLDEADIYLHPEWQRKFLFELSQFFDAVKNNFGHLGIDLVLTTHSPLMISDLFKEDVYLISEDEGQFHKAVAAKNETFGANIFQLYRDEFIVSNPKGEIANLSIKDVLNKLKEAKKKSIKPDGETMNVLARIGDPLIKIGLSNMVNNNA